MSKNDCLLPDLLLSSLASCQVCQFVILETEGFPGLVCCFCVIHDPFVQKHHDTARWLSASRTQSVQQWPCLVLLVCFHHDEIMLFTIISDDVFEGHCRHFFLNWRSNWLFWNRSWNRSTSTLADERLPMWPFSCGNFAFDESKNALRLFWILVICAQQR